MEKSKRYKIVLIISTVLMTLLTLMTSYLVVFDSSNLNLGVEWNMFNSILIIPLYIVGLVVAFRTKIKGSDTIIKTTYADGRATTYEKDNDLISWMFGHIIVPGLIRFAGIPLAVAAIIYYPLMFLWSLVGIVLPYILAVALLVVPFFYYKIAEGEIVKTKRHIRLPLLTFGFFSALFVCYGIWTILGGVGSYGEYSSDVMHGMISLGIFILFMLIFLALTLTVEEDTIIELIEPEPMTRATRIMLIAGGTIVSALVILGLIFIPSSSSNYQSDSIPDLPTYTHSIKATVLNIRSTPSTSATIVGKLTQGEKVNARIISDGWAVIIYNGNSAYISADYIAELDSPNNTVNKPMLASTINIPKMTGRMSTLAMGWQDYLKEPALSQSETDRLKLPKAEGDTFYAKGKKIYECSQGRLETYLVVVDDHMTGEYLMSYDSDGNEIDKLLIGNIMNYAGDRMYSELEGTQILVHSDYPSEEEGEETYSTTKYNITDDLRFVQHN